MKVKKVQTSEGHTLELINVLDSGMNKLYDKKTVGEPQGLDPKALQATPGEFAATDFVRDERDRWVWKGARTVSVPARVATQIVSPIHTRFIVAHTIREIHDAWHMGIPRNTWLKTFDPKFTRMIPAFEIMNIKPWAMGDNEFKYEWFLSGREHARYEEHELLPPDHEKIGSKLIETVLGVIQDQIQLVPDNRPIAVSLSGGIDSTSVLIGLLHVLRGSGRRNTIYAHTLAIDRGGTDLHQAENVVALLRKSFSEEELQFVPVHLDSRNVNMEALRLEAALLTEEYHIHDVECAMAALLLCRSLEIMKAVPCMYEWNGDGANELIGDYPLQDRGYGLITLGDVASDPHLYFLGYPRKKRAHNLIFSGGLSRSYTRTCAPARKEGIMSFSPFIDRRVIDVGQRIPLKTLASTPEDLYLLRGQIIQAGVKAILNIDMPVFPKVRFQYGAAANPDVLLVTQEQSDTLKNLILAVDCEKKQ